MPEIKETSAEGSLLDFKFDNESGDAWFGVEKDTLGSDKVVKQIKAAKAGDNSNLDDDDEDDNTSTNLDDSKEKGSKKSKTKEKTDEDDEIEDEEEVTPDDFSEEPKTKTKVKEKALEKVKSKEEVETKDKESNKEDGEEEDEDETEEAVIYSAFATDLKEDGVLANVEIPKDGKINRAKVSELMDAELELRLDEAFEEFFKEMDDDGKAFLKFKKNGGATNVFLSQYANTLSIEDFDVENEDHVGKVIDHYLKAYEKLDDEELIDRKKYIIDSGKQKATATRWYKTINKDDADRKTAILAIQEKAVKDREERVKKFNADLKEVLINTDTIGAFAISKTEQKELDGYITRSTIKSGKNRYIPAFQVDLEKILRAGTKEDKENLILLAKLIKSKFDVKDLVVEAKTKVASKVKSNLVKAKEGVRISGSGANRRKSLADLLEE